jgi:succinyl-CoA synthetase alpha subunit
VAIFLTGQSRVMIQGITGSEGRKHGARMLAAGTRIVGGTNPRKAGQTVDLNGTDVPVFGTVDAAASHAPRGGKPKGLHGPQVARDRIIREIAAQLRH